MITFKLWGFNGIYEDGLININGASLTAARLEDYMQHRMEAQQLGTQHKVTGWQAVVKSLLESMGATEIDAPPTPNEPGVQY